MPNTKPTKADRKAAVKLDIAGLLHCNSDGRLLGQKWLDQVATIIARRMAPEREAAHARGTELALHQHEVKKLRERARREKHAADGLLERLDKRIKGCCGYSGKSCVACRPDISATATYEAILLGSQFAAEAMDLDKEEGA